MTVTNTHSQNPFIGLRAFTRIEGVLFFGRSEPTIELLERLYSSRFVAVLGYSGSGKSSLVLAGLIPKLLAGFLVQDRDGWFIASMRPGSDPLGNLAEALGAVASTHTLANATDHYRLSFEHAEHQKVTAALANVLRTTDSSLLILVDQFEELFRYRYADPDARPASHDRAALFVDAVLHLATQREAPIYVVLTMRADFIGDCATYPGLAEAISRSVYLIPRMKKAELKEAIVGPFRLAGGKFSDAVMERLWSDGAGHPDQLPVLQHALMRMWERWQDPSSSLSVDLSEYEAVGGLQQALDRHLEDIYGQLGDQHRHLAAKMFKCLSQRSANGVTVRRPTKVAEICAVAQADLRSVVEVVELFRRPGRSFLMPLDGPLSPETVLDISHESLIRNWKRLQQWVDEESGHANMYRRIAETASFWERGEAGLWGNPELALAQQWRGSLAPTEAWAGRYAAAASFDAAMQFLDRSVAKEQRDRADNLRQQRLRTRASLSVGLLIGFGAGLLLSWIL